LSFNIKKYPFNSPCNSCPMQVYKVHSHSLRKPILRTLIRSIWEGEKREQLTMTTKNEPELTTNINIIEKQHGKRKTNNFLISSKWKKGFFCFLLCICLSLNIHFSFSSFFWG
jgi:hypothetical protein